MAIKNRLEVPYADWAIFRAVRLRNGRERQAIKHTVLHVRHLASTGRQRCEAGRLQAGRLQEGRGGHMPGKAATRETQAKDVSRNFR